MAKKKNPDELTVRPTDNPNVMGLRGAVVDQPITETLDSNSLLLLYHDDPTINLRDEFFRRGVLVVDGYDFRGLDSSAARVRLPKKDDFPVLLKAIREISKL